MEVKMGKKKHREKSDGGERGKRPAAGAVWGLVSARGLALTDQKATNTSHNPCKKTGNGRFNSVKTHVKPTENPRKPTKTYENSLKPGKTQ